MLKHAGFILVALLMASPAVAENKAVAGGQSKSGQPVDALAGMEFVFVPGGCFYMGSENGNSDERPVHEQCVADFSIGKYEVTQGQWLKVMGSNPSRFNSCGHDCPVEQVSSNEALDFISRLNTLTGKNYRLPSEAEWEYSCRSGRKDEAYCGGNQVDVLAWYEMNSGARTHRVGQKKPNGLGIYDMSGNVWEWVQDWKGDYPGIRRQDSKGSSSGSTRMRRGGSWQYGDKQSRATWRSSGYPDDRALDLGFRLAFSPEL